MSKVIREEFVCDEHAQTHEAPYGFTIVIHNRKTGEEIGTFAIDACKDVVDWYRKHAEKLEVEKKVAKKRSPRKRTPRRKNTTADPAPEVIRRWAQSTGIAVGAKGRVPKAVLAAYAEAH
jgi:hypothetical protein